MENFEGLYKLVEGIVKRCYKDYYIHLWEYSDWEQEGMLTLYELLTAHPDLVNRKRDLYRYFKTKYRNRIHDILRKQGSQKRKLDREPYEEVSEIGHRLSMKELYLDELVVFRSSLDDYKQGLSLSKRKDYERLLMDERFKGRSALLRDLSVHLKDFDPRLD